MQFNKLNLKQLMLFICIMLITTCNTNKKNNTKSIIENNDNIDIVTSANESFNEQAKLNIQALQNSDNVIYFGLDKYDVLLDFTHMLDDHAAFLCNNPFYKVTIEGHADERGTSEYNIALGERRANSVKMYLQSKGVLINQIDIISYGKEKPIALGHNEEAYAKNRRAVLIY